MADPEHPAPRSEPPQTFAQTTPKSTRSYDEMDTHAMVFELQGTVHEIKEALRQLAPKIDDLVGFTKHRAPNLVDKADLIALKADLDKEISKRPTRRQAVADVALLVGLIGGVLAVGVHLAH